MCLLFHFFKELYSICFQFRNCRMSICFSPYLLFSLSQRGCKGNNFNLTCKFYFALTKIIFSLSLYLSSYLLPVLMGMQR